MKKFLLFLVLFFIIALGLLYYFVNIIEDQKESETLQDNISKLNKINASLIIDSVELAYNTALTKNIGVYPTLEQVKNNFRNDNAVWDENNKIVSTENKFECSVSVSNNVLKVMCLDSITNDLIIRE